MTTAVRLSAIVTEDHELTVKVPGEIPPGRVELLIQHSVDPIPSASINPARDAARAKLAAAGLLSSAHHLPSGTRIPSEAEVRSAGALPSGARPSEELIHEDRDEA
ncbi:MAG: hypothetical protein GC204_00410 [Chloroflexi bacterium]|nr:hypothetical protein [Chloroflexota bacterium]